MRKALFVWDSEYPWDVRVEKICNSLLQADWQVHLVCRNVAGQSSEEMYHGIQIHRVWVPLKKRSSVNSAISFPAFFSPVWISRIYGVARRWSVDLIIVRDLPMSPAALTVGKMLSIPVILDMAECYPELIRAVWRFEPFRFGNVFLRNPMNVDLIEHVVIKHIDHIFCMVEESKKRLLEKRVPKEKLTIVSNTPELTNHARPTLIWQDHGSTRARLTVVYVGFLNWARGLDFALRAFAKYVSINQDAILILIGRGNAENHLKKRVKELALGDHVRFLGWVDHRITYDYMQASDVCLIPHHKCSHWDNTVPNKLFDCMLMGKPVLTSDVVPVKRIVERENCGLVYKDGDMGSFVSKVQALENEDYRLRLGKNGAIAVKNTYNWVVDSKRMLEVIERIVRNA